MLDFGSVFPSRIMITLIPAVRPVVHGIGRYYQVGIIQDQPHACTIKPIHVQKRVSVEIFASATITLGANTMSRTARMVCAIRCCSGASRILCNGSRYSDICTPITFHLSATSQLYLHYFEKIVQLSRGNKYYKPLQYLPCTYIVQVLHMRPSLRSAYGPSNHNTGLLARLIWCTSITLRSLMLAATSTLPWTRQGKESSMLQCEYHMI